MGLLRLGYIRVSTSSGEQLSALENQRTRVAATGVDEIIQDVQSGRETDRTGYQHLLEQISTGKVSELVITRIDRLGRDAADTDCAIAFCAKHGVKLTALDGGTIESETPAGFVMSRILTTLAEMESRMLSQRIRAGLTAARQKHRPLRGRAPWGYRVNADKSALEPDPIEWPRATAFLATLASCNWRMNTALTRWDQEGRGDIPLHSCRAVRAWLLNPVLRGGLGYRQQANHVFAETVWDTHPALIPHSSFSTITHQLDANRRNWGHNSQRPPHLLTSLCHCGHCQKTMCYAGSRRIPSLLCKTRGCPQQYKSTRESIIRAAIIAALTTRAAELTHAIATEPPELQQLRDSIAQLQALNDPDLAGAIEAKQRRMQELHNAATPNPHQIALLSEPRTWSHLSDDELREVFLELVVRVEIRHQQVARVTLHI